jgi:hypothetical protein
MVSGNNKNTLHWLFMDLFRQKATSYMNSVRPTTQAAPPTKPVSSSINPFTTFLTALPGIAALILVLMRTSDKASTLSSGGFTPGLGTSIYTTANVGIGTNNPAGKLHVVGNSYVTTGNLGVGTISAASKLTVLETGAVNSYVTTIRGTNVLNNGLLVELADDTGNVDLLRMRSNTSSKFAVYSDGLVEIGNTLEDGSLSVYGDLLVDSNSSSNTSFLIDAHGSSNNGMFLTSSGKMVLGTVSQAVLSTTLSAPYKLQVFGDINIVGNVYNNGNLTGGSGSGNNLVVVSEYLPNLTVGGTLTVENEIRSNNFLTVVKDTMIGGNLTVMNSGAINGNLTVDGRGNFTDVFVSNDIFFNGNIYQDGELFGATNTGTVTGVTKYSDVNTIVLAASDNDWISGSPIYQEGRTITTSSLGDYLEKTFVITREGTYILNVNYLLGPDFGFATLLIDGLALTVNSEPQFTDLDLYSPWGSTTPNMLISYTVSLATGTHTIRIINQGSTMLKNPQSGGYRVGLGDSSLVYIPVAKSPTQVETRITINGLKPEDSPGWISVNTRLTTLTNGLILTSGNQFDGFYRDVNINIEGSYLMNFVLPLDPSYGKVLIEIIGPSGPDSVTTPLDNLDLYTSIGGAGSSRIIKSYSKTLSTGTYRLRLTNPGTKNGGSVGYTIGAGEINMILINAGLSSFGTVIFSTLKGDIIENDADGWIGANTTNQDKGAFSRFIPSTGFLNYTNESFGNYNLFSSNSTDYLNMKIMNNTTKDVYIAYTDKITGFLFVKRLSNVLSGGKYLWVPLTDKNPNPSYGSPLPYVEQNNVVTNDNITENEVNYSTQYVSLAVRKVGSVEYIYVAFIQQQDIYSQVSEDNINTTLALDSKVRVKRYVNDGSPGAPYWEFVSVNPQFSPSISAGPAAHLTLQIDAMGSPIIAYSNLESYDQTSSNANKLVVQRWNSSSNVWQYIINENLAVNNVTKNGVTPGGAYFISMGLGDIDLPNYVPSGTVTTSTTSSTVINMNTYNVGGELTVTIPSGLINGEGNPLYPVGCRLKIYRTTDVTKYFIISVTDYIGPNLIGTIRNINGTGTFSNWTIDYTATTPLKNQIYVAFSDGNPRPSDETPEVVNGLSVYTYDMGDLDYHRWRYLGPLASKGAVDFINLMVFTGDQLYIGFEDLYINAGSVVKFIPEDTEADPPVEDSWDYVGVEGFTNGPVHNLVMDGRWRTDITPNAPELYVGFRDGREDPLGKTYLNRMSVMYHDGTTNDIWDYITPTVDTGDYTATSSTSLDLSAQTIGSPLTVGLTLNESGRLYAVGDTVTITDSALPLVNYINIGVTGFTSNILEGVVLSIGGTDVISSWGVNISIVSSADTRHFTTGPVSETALAIRDFDTPEILTIYRLGEPIVYHGSYITIFDEIDDNPSLYPQSGNDGYGLEYEYFFPYTTTYRITVEYILGREFGVSRMRLNGVVIGEPVDCYLQDETPKIWTRPVGYTVSLFAGANNIRLENAGTKNGNSEGYNIGVASIRIEYFSVTRSGDMDNLTVTGNTSMNVATINSLSVANFTGIETLTVGTEVNSLIRLGNGINPATSVPLPMATLTISDTAQDLTFTNYQTAGGIDFQITTLTNTGLSTSSGMKLNRYGRFGLGVDIDNLSTAFGVRANLISGTLAYLENTNNEGNGMLIKTASNTFRNRFPLQVQAGGANTLTLCSDGFLGLGVNPGDIVREFTMNGNAYMKGGVLDLGSSVTSSSFINMSQGKATVSYSGTELRLKAVDTNSTLTLQAGSSIMTIDDTNQTISTTNLRLNARNTSKAWFYLPTPSAPSGDSTTYFNIQAISRIRAGVYSVRMTTPMSSSKYAVVATANANNGNLNVMVNVSSSYIFVVVVRDFNNSEKDPGSLSCVVYGI